jgi:superfamily II DNA/RNA helicase
MSGKRPLSTPVKTPRKLKLYRPTGTTQLEVLTTTLNGKNVFALLPTGYSKTMCFTLIPLLFDEVNIVDRHTEISAL